MKLSFDLKKGACENAHRTRDIPLQASVQQGVVLLAIGVDTLAWAALHENGGPLEEEIKVIDPDEFAADVVAEMEREDGDYNACPEFGRWIDSLIEKALERGTGAVQ